MKKFITLSAFALLATTTSAQAQLVPGLGGGLPTIPTIPAIPTLPTVPAAVPHVPAINASTIGKGGGTLDVTGSKSVDAKSGKAGASGSANGSASGMLDSAVATPTRSLTTSASGNAQGGASGGADAQLIGTDVAQGLASGTRDRGTQLVQGTKDRLASTGSALKDRAAVTGSALKDRATATGSALKDAATERAAMIREKSGQLVNRGLGVTGSASGNGEGSASLTKSLDGLSGSAKGTGTGTADGSASANAAPSNNGSLLPDGTLSGAREKLGTATGAVRNLRNVAGGGAANGSGQGSASADAGAFDLAGAADVATQAAGQLVVTPGTKVFDATGEKIGKVRKVFTDAKGRVTNLLVKSGDAMAMLPASNFSTDGSTLVSAMGSAEISGEANRQEAAGNAAGAGNSQAATN